jgi:hypothetical protein
MDEDIHNLCQRLQGHVTGKNHYIFNWQTSDKIYLKLRKNFEFISIQLSEHGKHGSIYHTGKQGAISL